MIRRFALMGAAGYVAPRHLQAIRDTSSRLVAACDPRDSVGILDQFDFDVRFFTELERFERHIEKLRRGPERERVQLLTVCSPDYLHDAHCRLGLRLGCDVICEKPLVISPWNVDALRQTEEETGHRVYSVLQLREHGRLRDLKTRLAGARGQHQVTLTYITARGNWYDVSWKGQTEKSGGLATSIGIHFFDLLIWLFGPVVRHKVYVRETRRMSGFLELERARVTWLLSVNASDLPFEWKPGQRTTLRTMSIDGEQIDFSEGFDDLHTRVYERVFAGEGCGIEDARPSIALAHGLRTAELAPPDGDLHPRLRR